MSYHPASGNKEASRRVDDDAIIKVSITKSVKGGASIPDSLINSLANSEIPKALKKGVKDALPPGLFDFIRPNSPNHNSFKGQV
jgi:hypothetical protein